MGGSIEFFQFDDGTYSYAQLLAKGIEITGTPDADELSGTGADDTINGLESDDVIDAGAGEDTLNAGEGDDIVIGGDGNNQIDGGAGADLMAGGAGDDTCLVDDSGDTVIEAVDEGNDTVIATTDTTLGENVENLVLEAGAVSDKDNLNRTMQAANDCCWRKCA